MCICERKSAASVAQLEALGVWGVQGQVKWSQPARLEKFWYVPRQKVSRAKVILGYGHETFSPDERAKSRSREAIDAETVQAFCDEAGSKGIALARHLACTLAPGDGRAFAPDPAMRTLASFDLYRKVPRDLTEPTLSGAIVSACTVSVALYLFVAEFLVLLQRRWESEMIIEESKTEEKLQINLNITMSSMPCELLSFDAQDVMGSYEVDAHGNLFKDRLTSKGDLIGTQEIKSSHFGASSTLSRHYSLGYGNQETWTLSGRASTAGKAAGSEALSK
ncbi:unnamed protein product [Effrenium voratum]|nr:unnamed protein product [Effrenium voratum]